MLLPLLRPALHGGGISWDELLLLAIGAIVLIVIAVTGGKPAQPTPSDDAPAPPDEPEQ